MSSFVWGWWKLDILDGKPQRLQPCLWRAKQVFKPVAGVFLTLTLTKCILCLNLTAPKTQWKLNLKKCKVATSRIINFQHIHDNVYYGNPAYKKKKKRNIPLNMLCTWPRCHDLGFWFSYFRSVVFKVFKIKRGKEKQKHKPGHQRSLKKALTLIDCWELWYQSTVTNERSMFCNGFPYRYL